MQSLPTLTNVETTTSNTSGSSGGFAINLLSSTAVVALEPKT